MWFRINLFFNMNIDRVWESVQYVTAFYSSCLMVVGYRIFKRLKLSGAFLLAATALVALHPTLFILAGSVNNDMLAMLLYTSAILWLLRWLEEQTIKNTVVLALCVGLGMMTKFNCATLAFVIAPFFLIKLFKCENISLKGRLFAKLALFGLISIPLGMWHPIRNLIVLQQPIGFVPSYWIDTGRSIIQQVFSFPLSQVFVRIYCHVAEDYNLPVYILKCSLFGEFGYDANVRALAVTMIALNFIVIVSSLVAMIYVFTRKKESNVRFQKWVLFILWIVQIVTETMFYLKYPHSYTMDFRYIVPTIICGAGFIGMACQSISNSGATLWRKVRYLVLVPVALFCLFSVSFFSLI
jgi:hypothetical protein